MLHLSNKEENFELSFSLCPRSFKVVAQPTDQTTEGKGTFAYNVEKETLSIVFDGLNGPNSAGGWNNESLDIKLQPAVYEAAIKGLLRKPTQVMFRSKSLYNRPLMATLSPLLAASGR